MGFEDEYLVNRLTCQSFGKSYLVKRDFVSRGVKKEEISPIVELDKNTFGADRSQLINALIFNNPKLSLGFEKQRYFSRMYLHSNLYPGDINHQYLICGPEFG